MAINGPTTELAAFIKKHNLKVAPEAFSTDVEYHSPNFDDPAKGDPLRIRVTNCAYDPGWQGSRSRLFFAGRCAWEDAEVFVNRARNEWPNLEIDGMLEGDWRYI